MSSTPPDDDTPRAQALRYIANERFHRRFALPATADHGDLTVSFADVGAAAASPGTPPVAPPVALFMPGMFASRFLGVCVHAVAAKLGVRVLVVDRPGMGDSTDVPLAKRFATWVELVPKLLRHLGIDHVALVSHSAGTLYLLHTLHHCRSVLDPQRPFIAMMAPWVDVTHSGVTTLQMARYIPNKAFSAWNAIPRFFNLKLGPMFASSGASLAKVSNVLPSVGQGDAREDSHQRKNAQKLEAEYGLPREMQAELDKAIFRSMFEANTVGANSEALQCLRKGPDAAWGVCDDYKEFVKDLARTEKDRRATGDAPPPGKLQVRAYFAETDFMIGKRGQEYVEASWTDTDYEEAFSFTTSTIKGVDHDTLTMAVDVWEDVLGHIIEGERPT
ncbi:hypothetical protein F4780DRAFT_766133 [Xylariomycetidae sp. FL0641]|nr:hypothetical protein F4780DRAFT_766133 [Xylariomycetidae sp. FL0641]